MNRLQTQLKRAFCINGVSLIVAAPLTMLMVMLTFSFHPEFTPQIRTALADIYMSGVLISAWGLPALLYALVVHFAVSGKPGREWPLWVFSCLSSCAVILSFYAWRALPYY
ncbi:hypothetical protein [Klebsiella sp. PL-2018]|uniref:hypothetical protein n=1 Tax=Klebsiella TaxID=570 RepID=UPI001C235C9E|nr:hypothetical protein [Klebsiella sp. PL-2018]QXD01008.1 hypothetical protein MKleb_5507 [Klebsiella sp. PL-2018]